MNEHMCLAVTAPPEYSDTDEEFGVREEYAEACGIEDARGDFAKPGWRLSERAILPDAADRQMSICSFFRAVSAQHRCLCSL